MSITPTAPALAAGSRLAGSWVVERRLADVGGLPALLAQGVDGGRAILFVLPDAAADPVLDEGEAARWGTVRHVVRDPEHGRVVVDEVPEGALLSDRLALGMTPSQGLVDELARRLREMHRKTGAHGQLAPDRVVIGPEGPSVAGWGLGSEDVEQRRGRDLAWISRLAGLAGSKPRRGPDEENSPTGIVAAANENAPTETGPREVTAETAPTGPVADGPGTHRLQAAILSGHIPTLRQALDEWAAGGGRADEPAVLRARDALGRLEKKVETALEDARKRIAEGDPLGAVAPCREAVRLGAEAEAEPLLKQARRQAKQMVATPRRAPSTRTLYVAGAGVAALFVVVALVLALKPSGSTKRLRAEAEAAASRDGERAAVLLLLGHRERGEDSSALDALLTEHLATLGRDERERLTRLRRESVAQGARPRDVDGQTEDALRRLGDVISSGVDAPALKPRLQQALLQLDRAAMLYRTSTRLGVADAARAAERLIAEDPVFGGAR